MTESVSIHYLGDPKNEELVRNAFVCALAEFPGENHVSVLGSQFNVTWEIKLRTNGKQFVRYLEGPEQHTVEHAVGMLRALLEEAHVKAIQARRVAHSSFFA